MRTLTRVLRNSWSEPPFWSQPLSRFLGTVGEKESIGSNFEGYVADAYKGNGIVFACTVARLLVFSEARFQWRDHSAGRPGELFGTAELKVLEQPWPNGTTGLLLARMEVDSSFAGNFFGARVGDQIRVLRPDWVTIITGSKSGNPYDLDAAPVAYMYKPPKGEAVLLTPAEVIHYAPIPDPVAQWRGMSWLTPVLNEIKGDTAATKHKLKFFENGAIPGMVFSYSPEITEDVFREFVKAFEEQHAGVDNAYKALHLGGGADPKTIGSDLKQLDFKVTQGAGETRIAAAARVHPAIVGLSEGLQGSSLNAGNYSAARRMLADGTIRPLWRVAAGALQSVLTLPREGAELWYDDRDIAFLRQDAKEEAEIDQTKSNSIKQLVDAGFTPESAVTAVNTGDFSRLAHSGLYSVQLQPAGSTTPPDSQGATA